MLRGYDDCPAYSKLREADKTTAEYQKMEADNKVLCSSYNIAPQALSCVYRLSLLSCKDTLEIRLSIFPMFGV